MTQVIGNNFGERLCVEWEPNKRQWEQSSQEECSVVWHSEELSAAGVRLLREYFRLVGAFAPKELKSLSPEQLKKMGRRVAA